MFETKVAIEEFAHFQTQQQKGADKFDYAHAWILNHAWTKECKEAPRANIKVRRFVLAIKVIWPCLDLKIF